MAGCDTPTMSASCACDNPAELMAAFSLSANVFIPVIYNHGYQK
ncbi:hypothetical protein AB97_0447 [Escherichia coli 1-110-08_S3_C1]|nr:hypothetical protein ECPA28_3607 [Escherichia coli PA28]ELV18062.1 hypothetical protein EC990814_3037 [Escherichia coli 99.0814]ELV37082.1 hypothetical protein EC990816_2564 [Escherichia coli 99.0816]EYE15203.1 hypothetical protein AC55_0587 [Escherichia coli 1-110-08_S3_C3]EYE29759.1 hypothetical protein AC25_0161 [Escherichia coli 1-110-08_S3_C2]EYE30471.1 hypothetical protein AB97_0447 [Escherichia coli 1-110-08_S3_C1]KDX11873.1 hypothetical protein AD27_0733 [Escherichia coli 2-177-06_